MQLSTYTTAKLLHNFWEIKCQQAQSSGQTKSNCPKTEEDIENSHFTLHSKTFCPARKKAKGKEVFVIYWSVDQPDNESPWLIKATLARKS